VFVAIQLIIFEPRRNNCSE